MMRVYHLDVEKVGHAAIPVFGIGVGEDRVSELWRNGSYKLMAEVEGNNLDHAYMKTKNLEHSWSLRPQDGLKVVAPVGDHNGEPGHRSTMVGDLIESDGRFYMVAMVGFAQMNIQS
jgi:hypothetical protein